MSLQVDPDFGPDFATEITEREPRRGPTWFHLVVAAIAAAFLGGAIGYVVSEGSTPGEDSVDVGFLRDMIDHHEQAVLMSRLALRADGIDDSTRLFAEEVMILQQREVGLMDAQLHAWGHIRGDLDRRTMLWMNMDTSVQDMPGMQPQELIDALAEAEGREADRLFLTMMRDHHLGGIHMADYAARHAKSERVRELSARMKRFQSTEYNEYTMLLERLGIE